MNAAFSSQMRIFSAIASAVCLLLHLTCYPGSVFAQSATTLFEAGFEQSKKRDFETAKTLLERALDKDPDNALGHYELAKVFSALRRPADALWHYRIASELKPDDDIGKQALVEVVRLEASRAKLAKQRELLLDQFHSAARKGAAVRYSEDAKHISCAWVRSKSGLSLDTESRDVRNPSIFIGVIAGIQARPGEQFNREELRSERFEELRLTRVYWAEDTPNPQLVATDPVDSTSGKRGINHILAAIFDIGQDGIVRSKVIYSRTDPAPLRISVGPEYCR